MKSLVSSRAFGLAFAVCSLFSTPAFSQDITATISGTITDASGGAINNAKVTVYSVERNVEERSVQTGGAGTYVAALLPIGTYSIRVEAPGFKKAVRDNVVVNVSDKLIINIGLEVGGVNESVTVEESAVRLQLQQGAEQSSTITGTQIRELALVTRNYEQLVALMPGVTSSSVDQLYVGVSLPSGQTATIPFSINGARNSSSAWLVDGADNVDRGSNLTLLNTPSIDSIAEFKVQRSGYSAESGRAGGAQVSVVTKSGTNELHGNVFEFVRNNAFAANNFYNNATSVNLGSDGKARVAQLHYNNFGGTLGGPVYIPKIYNGRNKTFFFFSEELRRVITYASGNATLPTTGELSGNFPHAICVQYSGSTCAQTSTTIGNIDPVAQSYIKDIFSKLPLNTTGNLVVSLFRNVYNFEQELYKIDHRFSDKLQVSVRFLRDSIPTTEPQGLFTGSPVPGVPTTSTNAPGHSWVVRATSSLTPTLLNEAGYNYSYGSIISNPIGLINSSASPDIKTNLPFPVTLSQVPTLAFSQGSSITGYGPYRDYNRNYNIYDNLTKVFGTHTARFGATYNRYQKTENAGGANAGNFTFTPASIPSGASTYEQAFANFLLGNVATFSQTSLDITPDVRAQQWEIYGQDDWRIRPNLTINVGIRYSQFRQPTDAGNLLTNFSPAAFNPANAPVLTANGLFASGSAQNYLNGIIQGGKGSPYGNKISSQANGNIAPRFGFAWDPTSQGKMAIRGGYGIFFDPTLYGTFEQNIFQNPPVVNAVVIPNVALGNPAGGTANVANSPKYIRATPTDFKTPYTQQWSLGVQRQVMKDTVIEATYVGTKGTHLLGIVDLNSVQPGLAYTSGLVPDSTNFTSANETILNRLRPYQGYGSIGAVEPWFNSNYNALQVSARKNFSSDALISISYTWSKSLTDNGSDRSNAPQNLYNFNSGEYGNSPLDRTQVFNANFVYTLPFFKTQQGFTGKALGGWQISGIASYYTGLSYTVTTSGTDPGGIGIIGSSPASLRPDLVCDAAANAPHTRAQWFNTSCFQNVPAGQHRVGNSGRGIVRGPGYEGWSFSGSKNLRFGKEQRYRFQLRGEASNAFNHTNPSTFGSLSTTSTLFGSITGYRDPRIVQLGAKFYF